MTEIVHRTVEANGIKIHYAEAGAGGQTHSYSLPQEAVRQRGRPWDGVRVWPVATAHGLAARVVVGPEQNFGFNSEVFAVTPGAAFTFRAAIGAITGGGLFGSATLIWLDSNRAGLLRTNILVTRDATEVAQGSTDSEGRFAITLPDAAALASRALGVTASSTPSTRGTMMELR